jgi:hypothetical protein
MADEQRVEPVRDGDGVPVFVLGVTMAGAVSAGAYTAGVLDWLLRALDAHERARLAGKVRHRVALKVMSGASAGGVSAALAVASLIRGMEKRAHVYHPVAWDPLDAPAPEKATEGLTYRAALGPLHDIWVDRLRLYDRDDGGLLGLRDLGAEPGALLSALNSEALDEAADGALLGVSWAGPARAWIAEPLELFLTTTNVNGAPYEVTFGGASSGHRMANHAHARHFRVTGLGTAPVGSHWLDVWRDAGITLALPQAPDPDAPFDPEAGRIDFGRAELTGRPRTAWTDFRETGVATGAFPVGLAARFIRARMDEYGPVAGMEAAQGGAWPLDIDPARRPRPEWGEAGQGEDATYVAVDGGVCNNEPFEYARFTLRAALPTDDPTRQWALADNPRGASAANRAVLMIDPFPEGPQFRLADPANVVERALRAILGPLLGALIAQARLKPEELVAAADKSVFSRFMIAPSRTREGPGGATETIRGAEAIACGGLGGFAGFFDEAFRRHDFVLGQRNCQHFLKAHFTLAADNPVFDPPPGARAADWRPVLHPMEEPEVLQPQWPRMPPARRDEVRRRIGLRLDAVFDRALQGAVGVGIARWFIRRIWANGLRDAAHDAIARRVEAALVARDQMLLALPAKADTPLGRRVAAELVGPGPHLRSVRGVAAALAAEEAGAKGRKPAPPDPALLDGVAAVFATLQTQAAPERYRLVRYGSRVSQADRRVHDLFHLVGRGPGLLRRLTPGMEITDDLGA